MENKIRKTVEELHKLFKLKQLSLSVAESCTGGLVSHYITSLPGASIFFKAGIVSYSEKAKENILRVSNETLIKFGMISEETAKEMADHVRIIDDSDYSVATTGILGPDAIEGKDIGLIYIAASKKGKTFIQQFNITGNREEIKKEAALTAMNFLIDFVNDENE